MKNLNIDPRNSIDRSRAPRAFVVIGTALLFLGVQSALAATFTIANGDVAGLISAINTANVNDEADTINLASGGAYTLTAVNNTTDGANGLPVLVNDLLGPDLTINGNGATIQRSTLGA